MHYLNIQNEDKKKLGILIHYYRTHVFKHISQNLFLKNKFDETICSRQTLSKIEQGEIIKNDSIYEELLEKLSLKYNTNQIVENIIKEEDYDRLLYACDYYDIETLKNISKYLLKQLSPFSSYVFFYENYLCMNWIHNYYSSFVLPTLSDCDFIINLKEIINSKLYEVMMDLVFKSRTIHGNYDFSYFDFKHSQSMINRGNHMMILYNQSKLSEMLQYCDILEKEYTEKNNFIRLLDIYSLKGLGFSNTEKERFNQLVKQIKQVVDQHQDEIPETKILQLYKNLGLQAFRLDIYDKAIYYFEKYIENNSPYAKIIGIDLCISYQKTNQIYKLENFVKDKKIYTGDSQYEKLLNYFILKYKFNSDENELSYFIIEKVPLIIDETMAKYKQFFYEELNTLVDKTRCYKNLKDYLDATNFVLPI